MKPALVLVMAVSLLPWCGRTQVPGILSHQGKLVVNATNFTGTAHFKFALVNAAGDATWWSHNGTSTGGNQPTGPAISLPVERGLYAVNLGDTTVPNMTHAIPPSVFTHDSVWLRIWVDNGILGFQRLLPDRRITAAGYALVADTALTPPAFATNFTGLLAGEVTGPQGATVVSAVGGLAAAQVAAGASAANAATSANTPNTVVWRSPAGDFAAGTITANHVGDGAGLTNLTAAALVGTAPRATNFTGSLAGDVSGLQGATVVNAVGGLTAANVALGANAANAATSLNLPGAIVRREAAGGHLAAGTISAQFVGDGSGLTNLPTSPDRYGAPRGAVLASVLPQDPVLLASGYRQIWSFAAPAWVNGATANAPAARSGHTAVWDGQRMIVWGGTVGASTYTASGGLYDANADAWTPSSIINAPAGRSGHTAVWTGSEMLVWGGRGAGGYLSSGGRFAPGTGIWQPTSAAGAPTAREGHVAVWTGTRMVVWGGLNQSGLLDDGAVYDPVANQWSALAVPNAPEKRFGGAAVWGDDRFIVWGGEGASGALGTGGQLLFAGGAPSQWVALPLANAPGARTGHTAVWAHDRMAIWGGQSGGVVLGDGAAWCPSCDQWKSLSIANAPSPRTDHAAVWTETEMLIVDGANAAGDLATSAAYDSLTEQWRALSGLGGPLARTKPVAVWTGTEVLVFGGSVGSPPTAVGALQRLAPQPAWYFYRKL